MSYYTRILYAVSQRLECATNTHFISTLLPCAHLFVRSIDELNKAIYFTDE